MDNFETARKAGVPSVHLNGTGRDALAKQYRDMHQAIAAAMVAFREASPHGRDYYVQGSEAYEAARDKHLRRYGVLAELLAEIEDEYCAFDRINPDPRFARTA